MIGFFKERSSFQVPVLILLTFLLKAPFVFRPHPNTGPLAGGLLNHGFLATAHTHLHPTFFALVAVLWLVGTAFYANYVLATQKMTPRGTIMVALSIILFLSLFPATHQPGAAVFMLPVLVLLFQQVTRLYGMLHAKAVIVNIGLIAGTGYLLYHPFLWFLPCCFLALGSLRAFKANEWLLLLASMFVPLYFILGYEFLTNQWQPSHHLPQWWGSFKRPPATTLWYVGGAMALVWVLAGLAVWQAQTRRMLIQSRKNWYQMLTFGIFCLPAFWTPIGTTADALTFLAFPAGAFAAHAFAQKERSLASVLLFWLLIITATAAIWGWNNGRI
ncbi:MAG: hypothetical protein EAY75_03000 [Bacteroidetes bacterium]|nr:MAG: hypothetical protein EAY75_03000 [Bacteroidota bacterium]